MAPSNRFWDIGRFVQTLDFFEAIPILSDIKKTLLGSDMPQPHTPQGNVLFDFTQGDPEVVRAWGALDDVVMGGVSSSTVRMEEQYALFTGDVSTNNSGGFVSIRTRNFDPALNLSAYQGIALRLQGDGQRYKFFLRDKAGWDALAYGYSFDTQSGEWMTVQVPFAQLNPVFRAKTQPDAPALDPSHVCSLQLMLSKFEYDKSLNPHFKPGPFYLRIQQISAF